MKPRHFFLMALLVLVAAAIAACAAEPAAPVDTGEEAQATAECPEAEPCPECETCPEPESGGVDTVPFEEAWAASPHADETAEAFRHWDEEDPAEVPDRCAKCHSTGGYLDFLGVDGSEFGVVDAAAPLGSTIECQACHNDVTVSMTSVVMPSGNELTGLDDSSRCMQCHQGRASTVSVLSALEEAGVPDDDTVSEELGFINIHYYAAAATLYGHEAQGGFEFEGNDYLGKFQHVEGFDSCIGCHEPHSLELRVEDCASCHEGVAAPEDFQNVRMPASAVDYDGDGDTAEGLYFELEGMRESLYQAITAYAAEVAGTPIIYDAHSYPYFFADANDNGSVDEDEGGYNAWTGRLLKAAYNYQVSLKDPGAFAHNGKYVVQLLYDSIAALNEELSSPVDMAAMHRNPGGHFNDAHEAFRHWDEEGLVSSSCAKCHSAVGLPFYLEHGEAPYAEPAQGFRCTTCHSSLPEFTLYESPEVEFPSGAVLSFADNTESNLCLNCHQGRQSGSGVAALIANSGAGDNEVSEALRVQNPHYFAAGATLFGSEAAGGFQYDGKEYVGRFAHVGGFDSCQECHDVHTLEIKVEECSSCHGTTEPETIRQPDGEAVDWDGDGDVTEGIAGEVETMHEALSAAIAAYAADTAGAAIVYEPASYPYYFTDTNGDGEASAEEAVRDNAYASWTPTLLRASYNYLWVAKDPGAFAHNSEYVMQLMYDSIEAVGGDVSGMTRP